MVREKRKNMICMIAEIIAVLAESYLAAHLLIQYFGMKEERLFWLKHILFLSYYQYLIF